MTDTVLTFEGSARANYPAISWLRGGFDRVERWLDKEQAQLPYWIPVGMAAGIICWDRMGNAGIWAVICGAFASIAFGYFMGRGRRIGAVLKVTGTTLAIGFFTIMLKSSLVGAPPLEKLQITEFYGRIAGVEPIAARDIVRLKLETDGHAGLPSVIRVNLTAQQYQTAFTRGAILRLRARLVPPAQPVLPGGYDFARRAWFAGIGATGTALGEVTLYKPANGDPFLSSIRQRLSAHIMEQLPGRSGAIASALATGDQGAIGDTDAEAMRNSGMAHLLSISGLHVTALVGAIYFMISRLLALFPIIALRFPVPIIAACVAAIGAVGYTLLTGSEVPTIRSCVAAILVLTALILGRDAISLRLVAFGASIVLLFWPEALAGPSFQLSFAAVSTIIILHETAPMRRFAKNMEDNWIRAVLRNIAMLLITGAAIEMVLAPIALFHFHKTGLYGALANIIAIPLTTFITMPAEAMALLLDCIGLGAPFWWITGISIDLILAMAHWISALPGAISMLPAMPTWAFAAMVIGGLWAGLLKTRARYLGFVPFGIGFAAMILAPSPDILVTGDGKHVAIIDGAGRLALLRERAGDYVRDTLRETAGVSAEPIAMEDWPGAKCTADSCVIQIDKDGQKTTILAMRSRYHIPAMELAAACKRADIVISERWLPAACSPRWLKADRRKLDETGGLSIYLADRRIESVAMQNTHAPWVLYALQAQKKADAAFEQKRQKIRDAKIEYGSDVTLQKSSLARQ